MADEKNEQRDSVENGRGERLWATPRRDDPL